MAAFGELGIDPNEASNALIIQDMVRQARRYDCLTASP